LVSKLVIFTKQTKFSVFGGQQSSNESHRGSVILISGMRIHLKTKQVNIDFNESAIELILSHRQKPQSIFRLRAVVSFRAGIYECARFL